MPSYRTLILREEEKAERLQEEQSTRIHKLFAGTLKPSNEEIIRRLKENAKMCK